MKALRWYGRRDLRYEDIPVPSPAPGQIKVKIDLAGICGTDLKEYASGPTMIPVGKVPVVLGHEFAGRVAEIGKGVSEFRVGNRVTGVGYRYCGECFFCRRGQYNICRKGDFCGITVDGCMAEYMVIPAYSCYRIPEEVSDEAAALVEPLAVAIHSVQRGNVRPGDIVAIVGDGAIGLCALMAARAAGASDVYLIAKHQGRGKTAVSLGATKVIYLQDGDPVKEIAGLTGGLGVDISIECVGQPETPQLAVNLVRPGGTTVLTGVFEKPSSFHFGSLVVEEKTVVGNSIYVHEGKTAVSWLKDGRIDLHCLVTSVVPLQDAVAMGFEKLLRDKETEIKILLKAP